MMPVWLAIDVTIKLNVNVGDHKLFRPNAVCRIMRMRRRCRDEPKLEQRDRE